MEGGVFCDSPCSDSTSIYYCAARVDYPTNPAARCSTHDIGRSIDVDGAHLGHRTRAVGLCAREMVDDFRAARRSLDFALDANVPGDDANAFSREVIRVSSRAHERGHFPTVSEQSFNEVGSDEAGRTRDQRLQLAPISTAAPFTMSEKIERIRAA